MASMRREARKDPEARLGKHVPMLEAKSGDSLVKDGIMRLAGYTGITREILSGMSCLFLWTASQRSKYIEIPLRLNYVGYMPMR